MGGIALDTLAYSKELMRLGFTQEQAEGFARLAKIKDDADKTAYEALKTATQNKFETQEEVMRKELATREDLLTTRAALELKIEQVRTETKKVRSEIRNTGMCLLRWQVGIAVTGVGILGGIMAKGFGWLGF